MAESSKAAELKIADLRAMCRCYRSLAGGAGFAKDTRFKKPENGCGIQTHRLFLKVGEQGLN